MSIDLDPESQRHWAGQAYPAANDFRKYKNYNQDAVVRNGQGIEKENIQNWVNVYQKKVGGFYGQ